MWAEVAIAVAVAVALVSGVAAALHAILYKRDVRAAIGWAGFIFVAPYVGPLLYLLFGVNRIRRSATAIRPEATRAGQVSLLSPAAVDEHLTNQVLLGDRVCGNGLVSGNHVEVLDTGAGAFGAILARIAAAKRSVSISTYIFEYDDLGRRVADALATAAARGVSVRVLLDAVGSRGRGRNVAATLAGRGVRTALFLPPNKPWTILSVNLRNHRKLTIVDEEVAFTGGMNISAEYEMSSGARRPIRDVHFAVEGPLVAELQRTFASDWLFATGERLPSAPARDPLPGGIAARVVADGPDEDFERSRWLILGAITMARRSIRIATPYFLPDMSLITALSVAALRGVHVEIVIPEHLDHRVVKWASNALLWQVLEKGCRVWFTPPPFDHSKLFTIDGIWTLFGSSNWDARSLRLNFESNVEGFGTALAGVVGTQIEERQNLGREITLEEMDARSLPVRIRDGLARLFTPYL